MMREMDFVDEYYADRDLSLLKKLTLVIPTYNRNYYLSRCLWYHAHFPFGEIIVADSSPEEKKVVNRETVQKIREMFGAKIQYLEYEPETEKHGGDIYRKWGDAVQHVETEYSQIVTDKEFLLPITLNNCIKYLLDNEDYIASNGLKYFITCDENQKLKKIYETYTYIKKVYNQTSETSENPIDRLTNSLVKQIPWDNNLILSLFRSKIHKKIYIGYLDSNINNIRYGEVYLGYTGYLYGKTHVIKDRIHKVRDISALKSIKQEFDHNKIGNNESTSSRYLTFDDYIEKYQDYKSAMKIQILATNNLKSNEIDHIFENQINPKLFHNYSGKPKLDIKIPNKFKGFWDKHTNIAKIACKIGSSSYLVRIMRIINRYGFNIPTAVGSMKKGSDTQLAMIERIISKTRNLHPKDGSILENCKN